MFSQWTYVPGGPVVCVFHGQPENPLPGLPRLIEDYWDRAGQRLMDVQVAGKVRATVDAFNGMKGQPQFRLKLFHRGYFRLVDIPAGKLVEIQLDPG